MRTAFRSVAIAIAVGGAFLSGTVLPSDPEGALAPTATIPEGPPQPPGWSCDGSNWIFFDRECGRRRLHKHHHHPAIAADGKNSAEARREPASASESSPAPVKPVQISLNGESAPKPEPKADARGNWREHRRSYPYGREMSGYEVASLRDTIAKAQAAGVAVLVKPYAAEHREAAMLQFPGGYIAEVHAPASE